MFKILTLAILFYFAYRVFLRPLLPPKEDEGKGNTVNIDPSDQQSEEEGEYIDYEEIDD